MDPAFVLMPQPQPQLTTYHALSPSPSTHALPVTVLYTHHPAIHLPDHHHQQHHDPPQPLPLHKHYRRSPSRITLGPRQRARRPLPRATYQQSQIHWFRTATGECIGTPIAMIDEEDEDDESRNIVHNSGRGRINRSRTATPRRQRLRRNRHLHHQQQHRGRTTTASGFDERASLQPMLYSPYTAPDWTCVHHVPFSMAPEVENEEAEAEEIDAMTMTIEDQRLIGEEMGGDGIDLQALEEASPEPRVTDADIAILREIESMIEGMAGDEEGSR